MTSYYMFIVNDAYSIDGRRVPAYEVACHRLRLGAWPLYKGTKNRNSIALGDRILVYIGGAKEHRQAFIASASVRAVEGAIPRRSAPTDPEDVIADPPFKIVLLSDVVYLEPPVEIRPLLKSLSFVHSLARWGAGLVGGCRSVTAADFHKITNLSS
jgi:hypothetical protein